jgi:hypothetical protein
MSDVRFGKILAARGITGVALGSFETGFGEVKFDWNKFAAVRIEIQPPEVVVHSGRVRQPGDVRAPIADGR